MGTFVTRRRRTRQPQQIPQVDQRWLARGLKFALLPSVGFVNLVDGSAPLQTSGSISVNATDSGIAHAGARAEFAGVSAAAGLTIISIWRSRASSDYLGADGTPVLVSNRTAINTGWSYGRGVAVGGASNGNLIPQSMTFQGVAQYTEANWTIESRIDTPVACRYDPLAGKISWFRFGQKSSADTSVSAPSAGGNLVFGAQGDFASNNTPWIDRDTACLIFDQPLTDAEIAELTISTSTLWQVFKAPARRLWLGSSASGGTTTNVSPSAGALALSGYAPSVAQSANRSVSPGVGSLALTGYAPAISQPIAVTPGAGSLTLTGYAPTVSRTANQGVVPGAASLTLAGFAPTVTQSTVTNVAPQAGALALAGYAPGIAQTMNISVSPVAAALAVTGFAPTVARTANQTTRAAAASLTLVGYAPSVSQAKVSPYPPVHQVTILSQSTAYASTQLVDEQYATSALASTLALATIMAESRIYATASLSDAAINQTASFV